jgi:hypothetical protein
MVSLSDNERAMLELLAETPRSLIPPMQLSYAWRLWRQGLAQCANDGSGTSQRPAFGKPSATCTEPAQT